MELERISVEVSNRCDKACDFCYSGSNAAGESAWTADSLVAFAADCAAHGVRAMSLGGGEPLQWPPLLEVLERTRGLLFRSMTSNGLLLDGARLGALAGAGIEKIHVSIHFPDRDVEIRRAIARVAEITARGIAGGVNLLVRASGLEPARAAAACLHAAGIGNDRIVYLPMRGHDTPTPRQLARVAGAVSFQSMTCLLACARSARFCSIGWDQAAAWCSYTRSRRPLATPTFAALREALSDLDLEFCGNADAVVPLRKARA